MTDEQDDEAIRRLGAAIRGGRACIIRSVDGNYVENLIKRVVTHLGKRSIIHYGTGGLVDEGPTIATSDPEATRDRIAWAADGVADPFAPLREPIQAGHLCGGYVRADGCYRPRPPLRCSG